MVIMDSAQSQPRSILLIISGSIAAYKSLELIRELRNAGVRTRCVLTKSAEQFVTPMSVAALSGEPVYTELFSLKDESEMGHIRLSRESDLILCVPASANVMAKMAGGFADDLATAILLASNKPIWLAPAMNAMMWANPATQANVKTLTQRGVRFIGPEAGELACGETGEGRMSEPGGIMAEVLRFFGVQQQFAGLRAIVTAGPTREAIDPVRYITNHSSGRQGYAVAAELARRGAEVTLVSGPTVLPAPPGVRVVPIRTADDMHEACIAALPADIAVCAAAVADWKAGHEAPNKLKKTPGQSEFVLTLEPTVDILRSLSMLEDGRPKVVVGFAAETENLQEHATEKLKRKGCDLIVGNDVSGGKVFGEVFNTVHFIDAREAETLPSMSKEAVAEALCDRIAVMLESTSVSTKGKRHAERTH